MVRQRQELIPWGSSLAQLPRMFFPNAWEDLSNQLSQLSEFGLESNPGLTVSEDKSHVYVEAALPGLKPQDIEITLENGILWVKGEKKEEEENKDKKFYRRASSSFSYRLALPGQIDETKEPQAEYQDGIMKISFAKSAQSQAKKIAIKNGNGNAKNGNKGNK